MRKIVLLFLTGIVAAGLAGTAAFFSIAGLIKLFAGASIAVAIMASTLEMSKLVIASVLYQYWNDFNRTLRAYLVIATIVIATITSIGIYGFLSGSYQNAKLKHDLVKTSVDSLYIRQTNFSNSIEYCKLQLQQKNLQLNNLSSIQNLQETRASKLVSSNRSSRYAEYSSKRTSNELSKINEEINLLNKRLIEYSDSLSKSKIALAKTSAQSDLSSELGSLTYISKITNIEMDKIVNVLILLFIIVFDPLAICMVLVFNFLSTKGKYTIREDSNGISYENSVKDSRIQSDNGTDNTVYQVKEKDDIRPEENENQPNDQSNKHHDRMRKLYTGAVSV